MGRRRYVFDESKIQKYIAEGRGTGEGPNYNPWLHINDLPSLGRSHRPWSPKTRRVHHLLSDGEWKYHLKLEADRSVLDIREQLPLNRWQTNKIALELGIKPPYTIDGTPYVMTIDFLVTRDRRSRRCLEGYSFKYDTEKLSERDLALHRVAEECLRRSGVPFSFIDQNSFNEHFEKAYDSVRACYDLTGQPAFGDLTVHLIGTQLLRNITTNAAGDLLTLSHTVASSIGCEAATVFTVVKHLIAHDVLRVDLTKARDLTEIPVFELLISPEIAAWLSR